MPASLLVLAYAMISVSEQNQITVELYCSFLGLNYLVSPVIFVVS